MTESSTTEHGVRVPSPRGSVEVVTIVAMASEPTIVCPDWCTSSKAEHVADLRDSDGLVFHHSPFVDGLSFSTPAFTDGTPVAGKPSRIYTEGLSDFDGLTLDEAEAMARKILAAVEGARA